MRTVFAGKRVPARGRASGHGRGLLWVAAMLMWFGPAAWSQDSKTPTVDDVVKKGIQVLLARQESYQPDPPVGRFADDELEAWQVTERERLAKLQGGDKASEWPYEGVYRVSRRVPSGYRVGGTAIVCSALVLAPGYAEDDARKKAVGRSIKFMLDALEKDPLLEASAQRSYDVRGWAHAYGLDFLLLALREKILDGATERRARRLIPGLMSALEKGEVRGGGWNYAGGRCSPFMTGSTLLALYHAKAQGFSVDAGMVSRALEALSASRSDNGAFAYSGRSTRETPMPGAISRAAIAELCLFKAGRSDAKKLRVAVEAFFEHWDEIQKRKSKQGTHEAPYGIAPYYFMYGHTYAAQAIESLPEADREAFRTKLQATLWKTLEADGSWNDRIFPRSSGYSTAMALLALLQPKIAPVPEWSGRPR